MEGEQRNEGWGSGGGKSNRKRQRCRGATLTLSISLFPVGLAFLVPGSSCHPPNSPQWQLFKHNSTTVSALPFPVSPTLQPPPPRQHPHSDSLTSTSFLFHPPVLTNNNRTESLKTALCVMPTSYEVWLREMQLAGAIVCKNDDRGRGTAESSRAEGKWHIEKAGDKTCLECVSFIERHLSPLLCYGFGQVPWKM